MKGYQTTRGQVSLGASSDGRGEKTVKTSIPLCVGIDGKAPSIGIGLMKRIIQCRIERNAVDGVLIKPSMLFFIRRKWTHNGTGMVF